MLVLLEVGAKGMVELGECFLGVMGADQEMLGLRLSVTGTEVLMRVLQVLRYQHRLGVVMQVNISAEAGRLDVETKHDHLIPRTELREASTATRGILFRAWLSRHLQGSAMHVQRSGRLPLALASGGAKACNAR